MATTPHGEYCSEEGLNNYKLAVFNFQSNLIQQAVRMFMKLDHCETGSLTEDGGIFEIMSEEFRGRTNEKILCRATFTFTRFVLFLTHFIQVYSISFMEIQRYFMIYLTPMNEFYRNSPQSISHSYPVLSVLSCQDILLIASQQLPLISMHSHI